MTTDIARAAITDFSDTSYRLLSALQDDVRKNSLSDGGANWIPVPFSRGGIVTVGEGAAVAIRVHFECDHPLLDLSWMAGKAYMYALYTGCMDSLRRKATRIGARRYLGAGSKAECSAEVGLVTIRLEVAILAHERPEE